MSDSESDGDGTSSSFPNRKFVTRSRWFSAKKWVNNIDNREGPLHRCLKWIDIEGSKQVIVNPGTGEEEDTGFTFMAVAHEVPYTTAAGEMKTTREYQAVDREMFRIWTETPIKWGKRNVHEVIRGYCKIFVDIDVKCDNPQFVAAAELVDTFTTTLVAAASERYGVECRVLMLDASNDKKFSRHITVSMTDPESGLQAVFEDSRHCGAFVASVAEECGTSELVDGGVYRRNGSLRMYGSCKYGDPSRPMVRLETEEAGDGALDWATMEESLISCPVPPEGLVVLRASTSEMVKKKSGCGGSGSSYGGSGGGQSFTEDPSEEIVRLIMSVKEIVSAGIVSMGRAESTVRVRCRTKVCGLYGGKAHDTNTIYYIVDTNLYRYRQSCYSDKCPKYVKIWKPLPGHEPAGWIGGEAKKRKVESDDGQAFPMADVLKIFRS